MMRPVFRAVLVGAVLIGGTALAAGMWTANDYESLPPEPEAVQKQLDALAKSPAEVLTALEEETGGRAISTEIDFTGDEPRMIVNLYADGAHRRLVVDPNTARIIEHEDVPRFPGEPVDGEWTETDSGLKYFDIVEGDGPMPDRTSRVTVHYTGWLVDGTQFDSSRDRGQPATFALGGVIPGWTEGVGSMREGGKRKLIIPHNLAYGPRGRPGIPPRATLIFDVELITIQD